MEFIKNRKLHFYILLGLITGLSFTVNLVHAESAPTVNDENRQYDNDGIAQKIRQYKNDSVALELEIKHAELEVKRLLAIKAPEEEFDAKNEAIGLKYEISRWQEELGIIKSTIADLEKANLAKEQATLSSPRQLTNTAVVREEKPVVSAPSEQRASELAEIRKQQQQLIAQSYSLKPADAALNLAKAKALEPLLAAPVLGIKSPLGSFFPSSSTTRYNGMMTHLGGNQYMLEAYLRPGKQEFVIGSMRFMRVVPVQYDGVRSLILLDAQDISNPVLEYFVK